MSYPSRLMHSKVVSKHVLPCPDALVRNTTRRVNTVTSKIQETSLLPTSFMTLLIVILLLNVPTVSGSSRAENVQASVASIVLEEISPVSHLFKVMSSKAAFKLVPLFQDVSVHNTMKKANTVTSKMQEMSWLLQSSTTLLIVILSAPLQLHLHLHQQALALPVLPQE